ncbi:hypothetical protein ACFSQE_03420 [Vogesella fluminis]|uniref:hypothetical protein n=1 Tax=Vogesella fluminis TaxID=1069161 RepID=UPI003626F915
MNGQSARGKRNEHKITRAGLRRICWPQAERHPIQAIISYMPCRFNGLILAFALLMTERYDMLRLFLICCLFAAGVHADTVRLAVGLAKPPYIEAGAGAGWR